jgi:hypothetical protein
MSKIVLKLCTGYLPYPVESGPFWSDPVLKRPEPDPDPGLNKIPGDLPKLVEAIQNLPVNLIRFYRYRNFELPFLFPFFLLHERYQCCGSGSGPFWSEQIGGFYR